MASRAADEILAEELTHIAKGEPGSDQETLRNEYIAYRKETLARGSESRPAAALFEAIASVRRYAPDFQPAYDKQFFV